MVLNMVANDQGLWICDGNASSGSLSLLNEDGLSSIECVNEPVMDVATSGSKVLALAKTGLYILDQGELSYFAADV